MKWIFVAISVIGLSLFLACDKEKDQYAGLSDLVADRQEVRKTISEETAQKKKLENFLKDHQEDSDLASLEEKEVISPVVVYEKQIEILDSESKIPLAKGVAFMNKSGQIVRIKVYRK